MTSGCPIWSLDGAAIAALTSGPTLRRHGWVLKLLDDSPQANRAAWRSFLIFNGPCGTSISAASRAWLVGWVIP
jgi:hypothetical protein